MRNLRLEELFIGAWVRQWRKMPDCFSSPMYVCGLFSNGKMYLDIDDNCGDPFDAEIKDVTPIPITEDMLRGFGFVPTKGENVWLKVIRDIRLTVSLRMRHGIMECRRVALSGKIACWNEEVRYFHELQRWWMDKVLLPYGLTLDLEWNDDVVVSEEIE